MFDALSACVVQHCEQTQRRCDSDLAGQHPSESVRSLFESLFLRNLFFSLSLSLSVCARGHFCGFLLNLSLPLPAALSVCRVVCPLSRCIASS